MGTKGKKNIDYSGKKVGRLLIIGPVPTNLKKYKSNTKEWYCKCDCGNELQLETRMISGNGKYTQQSCGCLRAQAHLVSTSKIENLTLSFIESFEDFEKYQFLHKSYVRANIKDFRWKPYEKFIKKFYEDDQFNKIYNNWSKSKNDKTYYDWYKPSLDHMVPRSRGGSTEDIDNLQFLTLFENLAKRDMTESEWDTFKRETNTNSDLFIRSKGGKN